MSDFALELQNQQQMLTYADQTDAYLSSRHDTVRTIEHTIVELGEIFQQLAQMVCPNFADTLPSCCLFNVREVHSNRRRSVVHRRRYPRSQIRQLLEFHEGGTRKPRPLLVSRHNIEGASVWSWPLPFSTLELSRRAPKQRNLDRPLP